MPTPFATDTFSDTAGTNLSAHTPDTGGSWAYPSYETTPQLVITAAGRLRNANNGQSTAIHSAVSSGAAVTVTWDLYAASLTGFIGVGVGAPSQATYGGYEARYDVSAGKWEILSFGSGSVLASVNYTLTAGQTYHCQFEVPDGGRARISGERTDVWISTINSIVARSSGPCGVRPKIRRSRLAKSRSHGPEDRVTGRPDDRSNFRLLTCDTVLRTSSGPCVRLCHLRIAPIAKSKVPSTG